MENPSPRPRPPPPTCLFVTSAKCPRPHCSYTHLSEEESLKLTAQTDKLDSLEGNMAAEELEAISEEMAAEAEQAESQRALLCEQYTKTGYCDMIGTDCPGLHDWRAADTFNTQAIMMTALKLAEVTRRIACGEDLFVDQDETFRRLQELMQRRCVQYQQ